MSNEAFEKWYKKRERWLTCTEEDAKKVWQAAKADSEREIEDYKLMNKIIANECLILKVHINDLREALEEALDDTAGWVSEAKQALSKTPVQHINDAVLIFTKDSLQEHDNATIERCARVCKNIITGDDAEFYTDAFAKAIREMKGK